MLKTCPNAAIAVVIATKDRAAAIGKYALGSLARSSFKDFVCVVWDASGDDSTQTAARDGGWDFDIRYFKAARKGSSSQRNDAISYVLDALPGVKYAVFIDDDSELSEDALAGVMESFEKSGDAGSRVSIVNVRMKPLKPLSFRARVSSAVKRLLGMNRHGAAPFLYNYGGEDEPAGCEIDWAAGGGMGVDMAVFRDMKIFFPEEFQRFGGYALGEDFAFSFYARRKLGARIINSLYGHFLHYAAGPSRLDIKNMAAAKWYNFHLLFDAIYENDSRAPKIRFKLFMIAAALKLLLRARSLDVLSVLRGVSEARSACRNWREGNGIRSLMRMSPHLKSD